MYCLLELLEVNYLSHSHQFIQCRIICTSSPVPAEYAKVHWACCMLTMQEVWIHNSYNSPFSFLVSGGLCSVFSFKYSLTESVHCLETMGYCVLDFRVQFCIGLIKPLGLEYGVPAKVRRSPSLNYLSLYHKNKQTKQANKR